MADRITSRGIFIKAPDFSFDVPKVIAGGLVAITTVSAPARGHDSRSGEKSLSRRPHGCALCAVSCFLPSSDGVPHFAKGMVVPLTVTASSADVSEPKADISVILTDFAFTMPSQIRAGKQIWKVTNKGAQPHEIPIARLIPGKTLQDALRFLQTSEGAPPFEFVGGLQAIDSGRTGWVVFDLPAGEYIALCFVPDPASGKAHMELGMITTFTVK